jgi:putative redox protein
MSAPASVAKPANRIIATWKGEQAFDAGRPDGPVSRIDGNALSGPSPVDTLLSALAACSAIDVVEILKKRRTPVTSLAVEVTGTRVDVVPRRLTHVQLLFHVTGAGIEREQAARAIELSITKYCSVRDSLDPAITIEWELDLH